ncbi:MAG: 4Fe-4S binding protein [Bacteroidetes bacterium]|nr:4Fe-4S binding protein [Bacteroidota bacterium]
MNCPNIYRINTKRCNSCFKCVRECPVNAISFIDNKAVIAEDRCVNCGICYITCPIEAIERTDALGKLKSIIKRQDVTVASLSPNWVNEYEGLEPERMVEALKLLGFNHVSETALGASYTSTASIEYANKNKDKSVINTTCPVVISTIEKYYPHLISMLVPIVPPYIAHARMLKKHFGEDTKIVYISSCPAVMGDKSIDIDVSISFVELDRWMKQEKIFFDKIPGNVKGYQFEPYQIEDFHDYIVPGNSFGDQNFSDVVNVSGFDYTVRTLEELDNLTIKEGLKFDLFSCRGGCLNGIFSSNRKRSFDSLKRFKNSISNLNITNRNKNINNIKLPDIDIVAKWKPIFAKKEVNEEIVNRVLNEVVINNKQPNCGACGYNTCREFAEDVSVGHAEMKNCFLNNLKTSEISFQIIINKLHCGMFFIDNKRRLSTFNSRFAEILNIKKRSYEAIKNSDFKLTIPFSENIERLNSKGTGEEIEINVNDKRYSLTMLNLFDGIKCGFVRNIINRDTNQEEIEKRSAKVIRDNIETMQKIAFLLGENASNVEGLLQSFTENQE